MTHIITRDERLWAAFSHLSALAIFFIPFGNILGPLVIWLLKRDDSEFIGDQAKEALNFQISLTIYTLVATILIIFLIGIPLLLLIVIGGFFTTIIAAIRANDGIVYRYPLSMKIIP